MSIVTEIFSHHFLHHKYYRCNITHVIFKRHPLRRNCRSNKCAFSDTAQRHYLFIVLTTAYFLLKTNQSDVNSTYIFHTIIYNTQYISIIFSVAFNCLTSKFFHKFIPVSKNSPQVETEI